MLKRHDDFLAREVVVRVYISYTYLFDWLLVALMKRI
jgi:hypothetical protein